MSDEKIDYKNLKKEIANLETQLKQISNDKEEWFKKKEDLKKDIWALIEKIKSLKKETDVSTVEAEKLKKERDAYNAEVKKLIDKIKELHSEKNKLLDKYGIKSDPEKIKKDIERLELKIETEALSIDTEKKLMDQIRRMKKSYDGLGGVKVIVDKIDDVSKQLEETKTKANEAHERLKKLLKEKRTWYREFFSLSKQITAIKKQQEKAFEMFISFKNKFVDVSKQLSSKIMLIKRENRQYKENKGWQDRKKQNRNEQLLKERRAVVEEKIKKGEKLTTEDLLVLQGDSDDEGTGKS